MAQGEDAILIPGTKKIKCLGENLGALKVNLTENLEVRKAIEEAGVSRERYPAVHMAYNFMDTLLKR
jgi:aryl-alcohol dehydrogenase-like predicted oxidoreductase